MASTALPRTALSRRLRLMAPVLAVGVIAVGVTVPRLADASDAALPEIGAGDLLVAMSEAEVDGLSGTVVSTSRFGLPELPSGDSGGSAVTLPDLLAGSTTARVWKAGDDRSRVAVDAPFAEYDVVRVENEVWTFDSASSDVTHLVLPEPEADAEPTAPAEGTATPQDVADALLASVDETTAVSVGRAEQVAGRAAYELVLRPRDAGTLVDTVRIAVDGEHSVPLRVQVFGKGQLEPAFEVAFTDVSFAVPADAVFAFVPPAGSTVEEKSLEGLHAPTAPDATQDPAVPPADRPQVLGSGWTTVVEMQGVELPEDAAGLVTQLATPVEGGRVVESALLSVLLLDDGRVLAGAVPSDKLLELARR